MKYKIKIYPQVLGKITNGRLSFAGRAWQSGYETVAVWARDRGGLGTRPWRSGYETVAVWVRDRGGLGTRPWQSGYETVAVWARDRGSLGTRPWRSGYETEPAHLSGGERDQHADRARQGGVDN